jgi:hypothetical protein
MNALAQIHPVLRLALPLLFTLALLRPVHAAESITMIWKNAATVDTYEVTASDDRLLSEVKQEVMTEMGLSPLQSPLYVVEKVLVTSTPVRGQYDPVTGLPLVITTEEYLLLSEASTLFDLALVSGDAVRLRQIAVAEEEPPADEPATDPVDDTTTEPADTSDDAAEDTDGAKPVKAGHHRGFNKKKHHHHRHGKHHKHKHSKKHRFG